MNTFADLSGRVAIVTGSAKNIGRAIALELGQAGAAVVVNARTSVADAEAVASEIRDGGGAATVAVADITRPEAVTALVRTAVEAFGRLDILVNNVGVRRETEFGALGYVEWREIVGSILDGSYLCSHEALPHLMSSGGGSIVNIGGLASHAGAARRAHVMAAKAGLVGLTRALAHDLSPHGITVNCVAPGLIETVRAGSEPAHHARLSTLVGRRGRPEEVASLVRFLCSSEARYITGQTIHANGGAFLA